MSSNLCTLCKGACNLVCFPDGKPEWWRCPACGGAGVKAQFAPPLVGPQTRGVPFYRLVERCHGVAA